MREASELPPYLDRRQRRQTGAEVLACGLPVLPDVLTYQMSIPVAYWKSTQCAVVLFLAFREFDGIQVPSMTMGTYFRGGERWSPHRMWGGLGWPYDPIAKPDYLGDLDGKAIGGIGGSRTAEPEPGSPAVIAVGRAIPAVKQIALTMAAPGDLSGRHSGSRPWMRRPVSTSWSAPPAGRRGANWEE